MYISCSILEKIRPEVKDIICCESCHIDHEEFGYDLCAVDDPYGSLGNHTGGVCCAISLYLDKNPLTEQEWKELEESAA